MPIYEYKCPNGHLFEVFHGMMEPSPETCEVCGASPLQRVLHPVAVHYKGSGFYSTDYGKGSKKKESAASSSSDGGGSSSGGSDGGGSDGGGSTGSSDSSASTSSTTSSPPPKSSDS
jgi:putative FmdB family regulatory protein